MTPLRVGLTGGIASGKSQVSRMFAEKSVAIIDADQIARDLFRSGSPLLRELRLRFGKEIFDENGDLRRKALGKIVFNSKADLLWLNQLTHPHVAEEIDRQLQQTQSPYVILDIPLLVDKMGNIPPHLSAIVDRILVVEVSHLTQLERLKNRDHITQTEAEAIIENQSTLQQKLKHADELINNEGSLAELESQVALLHNQYLKESNN